MTAQIGFRPPAGTTAPTAIARDSNGSHRASADRDLSHCRHEVLGGKHAADHAPGTMKKNRSIITRFLATGGLTLCIVGLGLVGAVGIAAADEVGYHHTSSYPAAPTWPAPPSWGSFPATASWPSPPSWGSLPAASTWSGDSSHPCCSR